jgi:hypothetical protein
VTVSTRQGLVGVRHRYVGPLWAVIMFYDWAQGHANELGRAH